MKPSEKTLSVEPRFPAYVGYADFFLRTRASVVLTNDGDEPVSVRTYLRADVPLFAAFEKETEIPPKSSVELSANGLFNPVYLAACDTLTVCNAYAEAVCGKETLRAPFPVTVLPFDWWEGLSGNAERVAAFVRPFLPELSPVLGDAERRMRVWGIEPSGYDGSKDDAHAFLAALYATLKEKQPSRVNADLTAPLSCAREEIFPSASPLELAVFACAALEKAGLNPVLALGKDGAGVGVWLYRTCFLDALTDDCETVEQYLSDGVDHLAFFDADDLYRDKKGGFSVSERRFKRNLADGKYACFLDVRRARLGGMKPCPVRGKSRPGKGGDGKNGEEGGYEIFREEDLSPAAPPPPLYSGGREDPPSLRQWERRLLDLSGKNTLLNFTGKYALHLACADADKLLECLTEGKLKETGQDAPPFGAETEGEGDLLRLEEEQGVFRVYGAETAKTAARLCRRGREAEEETGAHILYAAIGFLRYGEKEYRCAPLLLVPVELKRGRTDVTFSSEREVLFNDALAEGLEEAYGLRLNVAAAGRKPSEIFADVRARIAGRKGWKIYPDAYIAAFPFDRTLLKNDLSAAFGEFQKNSLFSALLAGTYEKDDPKVLPEDENDAPLFLTLPSDSTQFEAVALSDLGKSFVLHGPPGTGKSQTIANIISNALAKGRRVLFVAEKRAALGVVKARLDRVGIGEFCLMLNGDKGDKALAEAAVDKVLSLPPMGETDLSAARETARALREELLLPLRALHKKRRAGLTVYREILAYLEHKDAPDLFNVSPSFYASLTEEKLADCRRLVLEAAAAAAACGGVQDSPFHGVGLAACGGEARGRLLGAAEVLMAEIRHFKGIASLFLGACRQRMRLTLGKIRALCALAGELNAGKYSRYFREKEIGAFYGANKRLDACLSYYSKHFKYLVEPEPSLAGYESGDPLNNVKGTLKKLSRAARAPFPEADAPKFLVTLRDLARAEQAVCAFSLSDNFRDRAGRINHKKRAEFLDGLYKLHEENARLFDGYDAESFRADEAYLSPVLDGLIGAESALSAALNGFVRAAGSEMPSDEEDLDGLSLRCGALIDNIDLLPNWRAYKEKSRALEENGLTFLTQALEQGRLKSDELMDSFEKSVAKNFLETELADGALSRMAAGAPDAAAEQFAAAVDRLTVFTRAAVKASLIEGLNSRAAGAERAAFAGAGGFKGKSLRALFTETLLPAAAPCLLMSPSAVARYLQPTANSFDLVIFDEASQLSTAEAAGALARGKAAIVAGDPKQLPPASFFRAELSDACEGSLLDDCIALGLPERRLLWHYRSRHESLIAFSNRMYYGNRLCAFPSPDAPARKVRFIKTDGAYERSGGRCNRREAERLVDEIVRRLKDPLLSQMSMGVVTFSAAQEELIDALLRKRLAAEDLTGAAGGETVFVKNLENVQGDERDVILFSVCYGPDERGKLFYNFGPLNRAEGWRRLNVAVSRAREEMIVFSPMEAAAIDLNKTSARGIADLKAFLAYAQTGALPFREGEKSGAGLGKYIAKELSAYGYACRADVGTSAFKIDAAVLDPQDRERFILGILCDGEGDFSVKDRLVLQPRILKQGNWNVLRVNSVSFFNNPKREIRRIKETLDRLLGDRRENNGLKKYVRTYRAVRKGAPVPASYVSEEHGAEISERLRKIVSVEEPISRAFLKKRCMASFGVTQYGARAERLLDRLIDENAFRKIKAADREYFYASPRALDMDKARVGGVKKNTEDISVFDLLALVKGALSEHVSLYLDELAEIAADVFGQPPNERFRTFVRDGVAYGQQQGLFVLTPSDRVTLA